MTRKSYSLADAFDNCVVLQWGRVTDDAEMVYVNKTGRAMKWLQWGRVTDDAEIPGRWRW